MKYVLLFCFIISAYSCITTTKIENKVMHVTTKCDNFTIYCQKSLNYVGCMKVNTTHIFGCSKINNKLCCSQLDIKNNEHQTFCSYTTPTQFPFSFGAL